MSTFQYAQDFSVTDEIKQSFWQHGFIILKNLFSKAEVSKLLEFYENSEEVQRHAYGRDDGLNKKTKVEEGGGVRLTEIFLCCRFVCGTLLGTILATWSAGVRRLSPLLRTCLGVASSTTTTPS